MSEIKFYPVKKGIVLGLLLLLVIPFVLFATTTFFWHFFYPVVPTYPEQLWPKYESSGDLIYEFINLTALCCSVLGFLILMTLLKPNKSKILGLIFGLLIYILIGLLVFPLPTHEIGTMNFIYGLLVWPLGVCNCWLY